MKPQDQTATSRSTLSTSFADVAGVDEAKADLDESVDFLRNAKGTGETLLARAVSGEADVTFSSISRSERVEVVVGAGAGA